MALGDKLKLWLEMCNISHLDSQSWSIVLTQHTKEQTAGIMLRGKPPFLYMNMVPALSSLLIILDGI